MDGSAGAVGNRSSDHLLLHSAAGLGGNQSTHSAFCPPCRASCRRYTYKALPEFGGFVFENGSCVKEWLDLVVGKLARATPRTVKITQTSRRKTPPTAVRWARSGLPGWRPAGRALAHQCAVLCSGARQPCPMRVSDAVRCDPRAHGPAHTNWVARGAATGLLACLHGLVLDGPHSVCVRVHTHSMCAHVLAWLATPRCRSA